MASSRKKILYLIQLPPPVHGVSQINQLIYNSEIINKGFDKKLIRLKFSRRFSEIRKFNLKKIIIFFSVCTKLILALVIYRPHLVYFSFIPVGIGFIRDFVYAIIIKISKAKLIYHLHNRGIEKNSQKWIYRKMYEFIFQNSMAIHLSEKLAENELKNLQLANTKIVVQPNTVEYFSTNPDNVKKNKNEIRLLFFSNLLPQKGLITLLQAMCILRDIKLEKPVLLDVYGDCYKKSDIIKYKEFIRQNHLDNTVTIHGPCYGREKEQSFLRSDIFVFPSFFEEECFPLVILEAMQAGLAIVTTGIGAVKEMIIHMGDGLIVKSSCASQVADMLFLLIQNSELRLKISNNAKKKYNSFCPEKFKNGIREKIENTLTN